MSAPNNAGFSGVTTGDINTSGLDSFASSMASEYSQTLTGAGTSTRSSTRTSSSASQTQSSGSHVSNASAPATTAPSQTSPTTFATSVSSSSAAISHSASPSISGSSSSTATNAASNTSSAVTVSKDSSCNSVSCSSALKAAVAVPIVVAAIVGILLFFCCARRRRKRGGAAAISEKRPPKAGKKWTRHLRAFSFDAELLMGARFSSTNSIRSREASVRSGPGTASREGADSVEPSMHSIEEVAPPYRDAVMHVTPTSPPRSAVPAAAAVAGDPIPRPSSTATAPPPYKSIVDGASPEPPTPSSARRNPFSDSTPVSPIDESPFNDPPEAGGGLGPSRGSSMYRSVMTDDGAPTPTASEAGSIRQAIVGRRVSVREAGSTSGGSS